MKTYDSLHIKNIALLGHAGSGKTTLAETMLFEAGQITRKGSVEEKNTISDYQEIEHKRGNSIYNSLMYVEWKDSKINIIDTPGYDDFIDEVISALKVADTGIILLNSQHGVEAGTEHIWSYTEKFKTPVIFAVNQIDHQKADFDKTIQQARERFGKKVTVVQYPLNQGEGFDSIIDVLKMIMYKFPSTGGKPEKLPIPDSEKDKANQLHNELVEAVAENDEELMELFFEKDTLDEDEMRKGLKIAMIKRELFPLFCLSAKKNMGSGRLMGFIDNIVPATCEMPPQQLADEKTLNCDATGAVCGFIFKTQTEPSIGDMAFLKVYSGEIKTGSELINEQTGSTERINQLYLLKGKERINVNSLIAGDIGVTVKLKKSHTNNTLHAKGQKLLIEPIEFPQPTSRTAVVSINKGEEDKLAVALHQIYEEDPGILVEHSAELRQTIIHGQGEQHLSMIKWRLENVYHVNIEFVKPKISYRETIQKPATAVYRHKKQSGGSGQFGEVHMLIEPYVEGMPDPPNFSVRGRETVDLKWGGKLVFFNCIVGGAIDLRFLPAILKGIMEKMHEGPITGSYVRDIRVSIFDGKMHEVDSNDISFKLAGLMAFKQAFLDASPQILEPIYDVEVTVPEDIMGDVMSDLQTRRAIILGMESQGHSQIIKVKVPLAELYKYSSALQSISQGRAKHTRKFSEYQLVPANVQQKLMADNKEELEPA